MPEVTGESAERETREGVAKAGGGEPHAATPAQIEKRAQVADDILANFTLHDDGSCFCECPGINKHTTANGPNDCRVHLDGVPSITCFHGSCAEAVAAAGTSSSRR